MARESVLARLVVRVGVDSKGASKALSRLERATDKASTKLNRRLGAATAAAAAGLAFTAKKAFDLGSSVAETASKFDTVFGPAAASVQQFVDDFGEMAGLSQTAAKEITATTGAIVQGMGFAQSASAEFSEQVVRLAGDLSSFNNIPTAETARAIQAALTGEREQLKRLGIVVREADVQARALANSGKDNAKALTDQEKATATLQIISERAGVAVGDLVRTQDSAANQARRVAAQLKNAAETASLALLPALQKIVPLIGRLAERAAGAADKLAGLVAAFMEVVGLEDQELGIEIAAIKAQGFDRDGIQARLRQERENYNRLQQEILDYEAAIWVASQGNMHMRAQAFQMRNTLSDLNEELETSANVMLFLSGRLHTLTTNASGAVGGDDGGGGLNGVASSARTLGDVVTDLNLKVEQAKAVFAVTGDQVALFRARVSAAEAALKEMVELGVDPSNEAYRTAATQLQIYTNILRALNELTEEQTEAQSDLNDALNKTLLKASAVQSLLDKLGLGGASSALGSLLGFASPITSLFGGLFAEGGTIPVGGSGIVGESGPELVRGPATVTSSRASAAMAGGGDIHLNVALIQDGREVGQIRKRIKRDEALGNSPRLAVAVPGVV